MLRSVLLCIFIATTTSGCSALAPLAKDAILGGAKQGIEARANISKGDAEGQDSDKRGRNADTYTAVASTVCRVGDTFAGGDGTRYC